VVLVKPVLRTVDFVRTWIRENYRTYNVSKLNKPELDKIDNIT